MHGTGSDTVDEGRTADRSHTQVLVTKNADHLPLCRQVQIYARQGIELDRSTLADWGAGSLPSASVT
ncbi:transposase [Bradyrhizobium japonicum]|uniref:Transposase n=1 Tax=Bradyrhizobium japonicum TaxID=375 RepID=A0A1L3FP09_BRAJP|nr:transposase [Bradyrhizobium japonicum]